MKNVYVPESLIYMGVEYHGGQVQEVPDEVAQIISQHPQWSKATPPPPVDKFTHLRRQSLAYLLGQIADFEADIAQRQQDIDVHLTMNNPPPKQMLIKQANVKRDLAEYKAYVQPLIEAKEREEQARRAKVVLAAKARGATVTFDAMGNWSEDYKQETFAIGGR